MDGGAGGVQSMGLQRVGHNWATSLTHFTQEERIIVKIYLEYQNVF